MPFDAIREGKWCVTRLLELAISGTCLFLTFGGARQALIGWVNFAKVLNYCQKEEGCPPENQHLGLHHGAVMRAQLLADADSSSDLTSNGILPDPSRFQIIWPDKHADLDLTYGSESASKLKITLAEHLACWNFPVQLHRDPELPTPCKVSAAFRARRQASASHYGAYGGFCSWAFCVPTLCWPLEEIQVLEEAPAMVVMLLAAGI